MTGRFISEDPGGLRGGIDLYKYVADNPTNLVDPRGLQPGKIEQYYSCLNDCLHNTLNCNMHQFGKDLGSAPLISAGGGMSICGMIVAFEPYLAPAVVPCVGGASASIFVIIVPIDFTKWMIRNISSTLGCTGFCAFNTW